MGCGEAATNAGAGTDEIVVRLMTVRSAGGSQQNLSLLQVPRRWQAASRQMEHRQWTPPATGLRAVEGGEEDDRGEDSHGRVVQTREASRSMQAL